MKIAFIHNMEIAVDSRTQKEIKTLLDDGHNIRFCGWNKGCTGDLMQQSIDLRGMKFQFETICEKVTKRGGIRENIKPLIRYCIKLYGWLKRNRMSFEVIHSCNMDTALVSLVFAKCYNKKLIYDIYDDYADSHNIGGVINKLVKKIDSFVIKRADAVIICSEKRMEQLATKAAKRIVVIHNSPDIESHNTGILNDHNANRMKVCYVGNLDETRYLLEMIDIITDHKEWEIHIGGDGAIRDEVICRCNERENAFFYGRLKYEDTINLESECDIIPALYIPTLKNHMYAAPNKFYEALYLGKPTVMFRNTGMDEIVSDKHTGIVSDFGKKELENAFEQIYIHLDYWKDQKQRLNNLFQEKYSWEIMKRRLVELYKTI